MFGARSGGFFAGAVGGLLLALLLVGAVTFIPQHNTALSAPTSSTTTQPSATSTSWSGTRTSASAGLAVSAPSAGASSNSTQAVAGAAAAATVTTTIAAANSQAINGIQSPASGTGPSSLLTNLPRQTAGGLLVTFSPLLAGLLVAALVYSAYVRRQDSS